MALKVPHFRLDEGAAPADRSDLDRFYREARAAASLDHPNLCPVYDVGQLDGIPYIIMAYIKGRPLSRYIDRNRPMSQRRVAAMVRKLAPGTGGGPLPRSRSPRPEAIQCHGQLSPQAHHHGLRSGVAHRPPGPSD